MKRLHKLVPFLLFAIVISGCIFGNDDDDNGGNEAGWQIYGYVNNSQGKPINEVTLTLMKSGKTVATTKSGAYGYYVFNDIPNGTYTVVPSKSGYTFTPTEVSNVVVRSGRTVVKTFIGSAN